jgi:hypothetical protein
VAQRRDYERWFRCDRCGVWQATTTASALVQEEWACEHNPSRARRSCVPVDPAMRPDETLRDEEVQEGEPPTTVGGVASNVVATAATATANTAKPEAAVTSPPPPPLKKRLTTSSKPTERDALSPGVPATAATEEAAAKAAAVAAKAAAERAAMAELAAAERAKEAREVLAARLHERVRACLERVTPPDLLPEILASSQDGLGEGVFPRLMADFKTFLAVCDRETEAELRASETKRDEGRARLDAGCEGVRRSLQDLKGGVPAGGGVSDPVALLEMLRVMVDVASSSLPPGWLLRLKEAE